MTFWLAKIQESLATCRRAKTPKSSSPTPATLRREIATHLPTKSHKSLAICKRANRSRLIPQKPTTSYRESVAVLPMKSAKSLAPTPSSKSLNPHLRPPQNHQRDLNGPWRNKNMKPYKCLSKGKTMGNS